MTEFKRKNFSDKYFAIEIFECPIDIIIFAATFGSKNVTIENYRHYTNPYSLTIHIKNDELTIVPRIKQIEVDFQISNPEFISLKNIWDKKGCYAIFHDSDEIKFKATHLNEFSRYKALDNFKWNLEIAIPGSASHGWGQITSPNHNLIDKIENHIRKLK